MSAISIGILVINLISLSICSGLVIALLTSANRDTPTFLFTSVCLGFSIWIILSLVRHLSLSSGIEDLNLIQSNLNLLFSALFASGALYFTFIVHHAEIRSELVNSLNIAVIVIALVSILFVWFGDIFTVDENFVQQYRVTNLGLISIGLTMGYLLVAFWLMLNAGNVKASNLARPTLLLFFVYVIASFDIWITIFSLDVAMLAIVGGWIGFGILRRQVVNPQETLNRDLQLTNNELQRTIHDLAEEKAKTEELNIELIRANRYKDEFLSTMSHELRTPLNSIVGYSELLMTNMYGDLHPKQLDRLERIHRNGRNLTGIINAILDLNKIDSGRIQLIVDDFDLIELIRELKTQYQTLAEETSLDFIIDLPEKDEFPMYRGDQARINQVLQIILENAFEFTTEGHVTIKLNYAIVKQGMSELYPLPTIGWLKDGQWAIIEIQDTGEGIAPEDQGRIFDRFSQLDSSRTREHDGIGLGLTIARKLTELHDGIIWVKSQVGQGSTFHIALPIQSNTNLQLNN